MSLVDRSTLNIQSFGCQLVILVFQLTLPNPWRSTDQNLEVMSLTALEVVWSFAFNFGSLVVHQVQLSSPRKIETFVGHLTFKDGTGCPTLDFWHTVQRVVLVRTWLSYICIFFLQTGAKTPKDLWGMFSFNQTMPTLCLVFRKPLLVLLSLIGRKGLAARHIGTFLSK